MERTVWGTLIGGFVLLVGSHMRRSYKGAMAERGRVRWTDAARWEKSGRDY